MGLRHPTRSGSAALALSFALLLLIHGCGGHPEKDSGPDAFRDQATPVELGTWMPDDIKPGGDRTDWKRFQQEDPDFARIRLVVPQPDSEVLLGLYDVYGQRLAEARKPAGSQVAGQVEIRQHLERGLYYIRVRATRGPVTNYSLRVDMGAAGDEEDYGGGSGDTPPPE